MFDSAVNIIAARHSKVGTEYLVHFEDATKPASWHVAHADLKPLIKQYLSMETRTTRGGKVSRNTDPTQTTKNSKNTNFSDNGPFQTPISNSVAASLFRVPTPGRNAPFAQNQRGERDANNVYVEDEKDENQAKKTPEIETPLAEKSCPQKRTHDEMDNESQTTNEDESENEEKETVDSSSERVRVRERANSVFSVPSMATDTSEPASCESGDEVCDYERERQKNISAREAFFRTLNLGETAKAFSNSVAPKSTTTPREKKPAQKRKMTDFMQPRRSSARIQKEGRKCLDERVLAGSNWIDDDLFETEHSIRKRGNRRFKASHEGTKSRASKEEVDDISDELRAKYEKMAATPAMHRALEAPEGVEVIHSKTHSKDMAGSAPYGTSCHWCRQKTVDLKGCCSLGGGYHPYGTYTCGPCLYNRYNLNILDVIKDPTWVCPPCLGQCNCSNCLTAIKQAPTKQMASLAAEEGLTVNQYLMRMRSTIKFPRPEHIDAIKGRLPNYQEIIDHYYPARGLPKKGPRVTSSE
eukprot:comp15317_c0_seq1/m.12165 comp15317_c0_seq1/g.12165  ORF comp15317_c0_seq1/g.12165 comp15317_c0_seq1/m.12165 type:complete len:526 (-) comp15317_c0_seq1:627-2204(-)